MGPSHKRTLAVAGIGLGLIILGMLWSIANTALASIQKDLSATVLQLQWMMNSFGNVCNDARARGDPLSRNSRCVFSSYSLQKTRAQNGEFKVFFCRT